MRQNQSQKNQSISISSNSALIWIRHLRSIYDLEKTSLLESEAEAEG